MVISFDSLRTDQAASVVEIEAVKHFLEDPDHLIFVCPHHDIGEAQDLQARFRLQIACGRTLELDRTGHYLFLERPRETAEWINSFLASENPCAWTPGPQAAREK